MVWITVDVDLDDISDADIKQEYLRRDLGGENEVAEQAKKFVQHLQLRSCKHRFAFIYNKIYLKSLFNKGFYIHNMEPNITEDVVKNYVGYLNLPSKP